MSEELNVEEGEERKLALIVHGDFIDLLIQSLLQMPNIGDQTKHVFR